MSTDNSPSVPLPEPQKTTDIEGASDKPHGTVIIEGISYIPSNVFLSGIPKLTFKDNRVFGVLDPRGEAPRIYAPSSELGLYFNDTRHLSVWESTINGLAPVALANELRFNGSTLVISMTNRDLPRLGTDEAHSTIHRDTFLIRRILILSDDTLFEILAIRNFDTKSHLLQLEQWAGTRFDDVFEVRGYTRPKRGRMLPPQEFTENNLQITLLQYEGLDNQTRRTYIHRLFKAEKIRLSPNLAGYFTRIEIGAKSDVYLKSIISFDNASNGKLKNKCFDDLNIQEAMDLVAGDTRLTLNTNLEISTDNAILNRSIYNARRDINTLLTLEDTSLLYPYAGIPWFSAPFGRDGIISAYQMLPWYPELARGVLDYVFSRLGTRVNEFTDEQPGKIFHEMRRGEMSNTREVPFTPYYGSVDATPLSLILLHEYINWSMDLTRLHRWWPQALRAMAWIEKWGDSDQDGFIEYSRQSPSGLVNQGWKDSHDSIVHQDGRIAQAPIRLCEVQAYAFRARMGMSQLAKLIGNPELATRLRLEALQLRTHFLDEFWDKNKKSIYLALDGANKPCAVLSSNMGHCLWSQILQPEQAAAVTNHLMSDSMFSGHGIRTLSDIETAYNPMSYHNGSVWPHDNSMILEGFRNYADLGALERLATAFMGVLESSRDFRLPELFCGFRKRGNEPPVPYEVACKPQAWAAGSIFLMIKSMLGLSVELDQAHLVCHSPVLTTKVNRIEVKGLRARDWEIDMLFERSTRGTTVNVTRKVGNVRVLTVK